MAAPRKEDVKGIILDVTERLLSGKALADISLAQIAREAGISKGTLYYHYKTKDNILFDITDRYLDQQWDELLKWTGDKTKDTSIHRLVKYVAERSSAFADTRMHLIYGAMLGNEDIRQKLIDRYAAFARLICEKIAERTDSLPADYLTWLILLASDGLIIQKMLRNDDIDIADFISQSAALIKRMNYIVGD